MDPLNPFADPFRNPFGSPFADTFGAPPRPAAVPPLPPAEAESLLTQITDSATGGLSYLGKVLDKTFGGRAIRGGVLGGNPRELLSVLPGSDTLGLTRESDTVTGRQLLEKAGVVGPPEPGLDWGDAAGFGADVLTDPASYLSFGASALTKAGKAAKKAGSLPKTTSGRIAGAQYGEDQIAKLLAGAVGAPETKTLIPPGASVLSRDASKIAAREGLPEIIPQFERRLDATGPAAWNPATQSALNPAASYQDAADLVAQGINPGKPGTRYARWTNPASGGPANQLDELLVGPRGTRQRGLVQTDVPTGAATPLGGVAAVDPLPFGINRLFGVDPYVVGASQGGLDFLAKTGKVGNFLLNNVPGAAAVSRGVVEPLGRQLSALFDPSVRGATSPQMQALSREVYRPAERAGFADLRSGLQQSFAEAKPLTARNEQDALDLFRSSAEGFAADPLVGVPRSAAEYRAWLQRRDPARFAEAQAAGTLNDLDRNWGRVQQVGEGLGDRARQYLGQERALGIATPELSDVAAYFPRQKAAVPGEEQLPFWKRTYGRVQKELDARHASQIGREDIFRDVPGGTVQLNDWAKDPRLSGPARTGTNPGLVGPVGPKALNADVAGEIRARLVPHEVPHAPEFLAGKDEQAAKLADWLGGLNPGYAAGRKNFFEVDPFADLAARGSRSVKSQSAAQAIHEAARRFAVDAGTLPQGGGVPLSEMFSKLGLTAESAPGVRTAEELFSRNRGVPLADVGKYAVPREVAADMEKWGRAWQNPQELKPVLAAWDAALNMFKTWVTTPFPSFHARNLVSGLFNQWRDSALSTKAMAEAKDVLSGKGLAEPLPGMPAGLRNPQAIRDALVNEAVAHNVAFTGGARTGVGDMLGREEGSLAARMPGQAPLLPIEDVASNLAGAATPFGPGMSRLDDRFLERAGVVSTSQRQALADAMGVGRADLSRFGVPAAAADALTLKSTGQQVGEFARGFKPTSYNPVEALKSTFDISGVANPADRNVLVGQGRKLGNTTEDFVRLSHYLAKRRQGFTPEAASEAVKRYHIDYGDATGFEREVMKRLAPFYMYTSRNLPVVLSDLAEQPAKLAASIRAGSSHDKGDFVPAYVGEGTSLPLPQGVPGFDRYLSNFGLPVEDEGVKAIGSLLKGDVRRAGQMGLGMVNPLVKAPLESVFGVQAHTGRPLADLRPTAAGSGFGLFGDDVAWPLSQVIANTPASRAAGVIDKLIDDRKGPAEKGVNLLTGARVTDVDAAKTREYAARDLIAKMLKGDQGVSSFEKLYVKPENLPLLTPDQLELYRLNKSLEDMARERAKAAGQGQ